MKDNKICIYINAYIANNLGDDMFIFALCNHYSMINFYIESSSVYSKSFYKLRNLKVLLSEHITNRKDLLKIIDFQVLIGGSLFMEPTSIHNIENKFHKVTSYRLSDNIPFFIIGANFGEYTQKNFFELFNQWFKTLDGICFRDYQSYHLFKKLENTIWAPDLIFTYKMPVLKHKDNNIVISPIYKTERTGLPSFSNEQYLTFLAQISEKYINKGFKIILASFCSAQLDDIACQKIYSYIPDKLKCFVDIIYYENDINSFLNKIINAKYIIGTRFHSIIIALKNKIPVFPIIYNIKTQNIIKSYKFKGKYSNITDLLDTNFELIDYNRKTNYILNISNLEKKAYLQYHFLNEAIINKIGVNYDK